MGVNKVILGDETLLDLTNDTVTADTLYMGVTAHGADGELITGRMSGSGETEFFDVLLELNTSTFNYELSGVSYADIMAAHNAGKKIVTYAYIPELIGLGFSGWLYGDMRILTDDGIFIFNGIANGIVVDVYINTDGFVNIFNGTLNGGGNINPTDTPIFLVEITDDTKISCNYDELKNAFESRLLVTCLGGTVTCNGIYDTYMTVTIQQGNGYLKANVHTDRSLTNISLASYETTENRTAKIDSTKTPVKYPTARAVYDFVPVFMITADSNNKLTIPYQDVQEAATAKKPLIFNGVIFNVLTANDVNIVGTGTDGASYFSLLVSSGTNTVQITNYGSVLNQTHLTTTINSLSINNQVPSAKAVYDFVVANAGGGGVVSMPVFAVSTIEDDMGFVEINCEFTDLYNAIKSGLLVILDGQAVNVVTCTTSRIRYVTWKRATYIEYEITPDKAVAQVTSNEMLAFGARANDISDTSSNAKWVSASYLEAYVTKRLNEAGV